MFSKTRSFSKKSGSMSHFLKSLASERSASSVAHGLVGKCERIWEIQTHTVTHLGKKGRFNNIFRSRTFFLVTTPKLNKRWSLSGWLQRGV